MEPNSKHTPHPSGGSNSGSDTASLASTWSRTRVKNILNVKGYIIGRCIGSGSYSKVYQAFYRPACLESGPGHSIACKLIDRRRTSKDYERLLPRETVAMLALSHPHIVSVMSIQEYGPFVCVFMDYCRYGDLLQYIQTRKRISERRSRLFFRQLVDAAHDMWSLGCVLFIMVSGTMPFDESNIAVTIGHQERKQYGYPSDMKLNPSIMDLIDRLIEPDTRGSLGSRAVCDTHHGCHDQRQYHDDNEQGNQDPSPVPLIRVGRDELQKKERKHRRKRPIRMRHLIANEKLAGWARWLWVWIPIYEPTVKGGGVNAVEEGGSTY
uniref:Protein kinase domain-containing protein n=1 Tax=Anopheles maculatus TaxID=74869 RepID=A0A182T7F0_9DIPT